MALNLNTVVKISAVTTGLGSIDQLNNKLRDTNKTAGGIGGAFKGLGGALSGALAGIASVGAIAAFSSALIDLGDQLWTVHERTGVAVEDLSKFQGAAEKSGTSLEAVAKGITRLNKSLGLKDDTFDILKNLGVDTTNATTAMMGLADVFEKTEDPALRTALAMQVFGKSGADLVPLLSQGREEIERTSSAITTEFAQAADNFNDSLADLKRASQMLAVDGLMPIVTALADVAKGFAMVEQANGGGAGYGVFDLIGDAVRVLAIGINTLIEGLKQTYFFLVAINGAAQDIANMDFSFTNANAAQARAKASIDSFAGQTMQMIDGSKLFGNGFSYAENLKAQEQQRKAEAAAKAANDSYGGSRGPTGRGRGGRDADVAWELYRLANPQKPEPKAPKPKKNETGPDSYERAIQQNARIIAQLEAEAKSIGKSNLERERAAAIAELEAAGIKKGTAAYDARLAAVDKLNAAKFNESLRETTDALDEEIAAMKREAEQMGMTTVERELANNAVKFELLLKAKSIGLTEEQIKQLEEELRVRKQISDEIIRNKDAQKGDWLAGAKQGVKEYYDSISDIAGATKNLVADAFKGMEDALLEFVTTGKMNFKQFAADIIKEILRIWIRYMIIKPLMDSIGAIFPGLGLPGRALGGAVAGGSAYLVGENGPEIFTPSNSGRITPNTQIGGGAGVSVVVNVNADSGATTTSGDSGDAAKLGRLIAARVREEIITQRRVGGLLA